MASGPFRRNVAEMADDLSLDIDVLAREIIRQSPPEVDALAERIIAKNRTLRLRTEPAAKVITRIRKLSNSDDLWFPPDDGSPGQKDAA